MIQELQRVSASMALVAWHAWALWFYRDAPKHQLFALFILAFLWTVAAIACAVHRSFRS